LGPADVQALHLFFEPPPGALGEAGQVLDQGIEAAVLEILQPAQGGDHPLPDATALAHAVDELEVGAGGAVFIHAGSWGSMAPRRAVSCRTRTCTPLPPPLAESTQVYLLTAPIRALRDL